jgi:hypothetical protein
MPERINHLAVFVAAIVFFLWGGLWYDVLFGKAWTSALGPAASQIPAPSPYLFLASFVLGWCLAMGTAIALTRRPEDQTVQQGVSFAIFMGLTIWVTMSAQQNLYEGRSVILTLINAGYVLGGFALIGAIVGGWKKRGVPAP